MLVENFRLMARYNQWMNNNLYTCARHLDPTLLAKDQGAFFGSILGTLNHLLVADVIWMQRFALHPLPFASLDYIRQYTPPVALNQIVHDDLASLRRDRNEVDLCLIAFCAELSDPVLDTDLHYKDTKGNPYSNKLSELLLHLFNHQTHHRGQTTTLFSQSGVDAGVTDLLFLLRQGK